MDYILVDNFNDIKELKLDPNCQYLCLMECFNGAKMAWKAVVGYFYEKGDEISLYDNDNGRPLKINIPETGFYYIHQLPGKTGNVVWKLNEVRYYKKIEYPNTDPDSFMQIEN